MFGRHRYTLELFSGIEVSHVAESIFDVELEAETCLYETQCLL